MKKKASIIVIGVFILAVLLIWLAGGFLAGPARANVGKPPAGLSGQEVQIASRSGAELKGWRVPGEYGRGVVILMHGVRSNRESMVERAKFLSAAGYGVLLFDFQAHGESGGDRITFGYLESRDAASAVELIRLEKPLERIGVIGVSLGGAASLLADPPLDVQAMVLESVYPTIEEAVSDRLTMRLGDWAGVLTPLLTAQLKPRIGIGVDQLRPIEAAKTVRTPKLFIFGTEDRHTRLDESQRLLAAASAPKESWAIDGAAHVDLCDFAKNDYRARILNFFGKYLRDSK
jgi:fermentation-respiration switch protein FrsA (DUF1100 family)